MPKKISLKAIKELKCPRCRKGKMFSTAPYDLKKFHVMNKTCDHCGLYFEVEPGFFYGAMYISYVFTVAWMVAVAIFYYLIFREIRVAYIVVTLGITMFLLMPFIFRYGRVIFLHLFGGVPYDEIYSK